jgi:hypothetical protein
MFLKYNSIHNLENYLCKQCYRRNYEGIIIIIILNYLIKYYIQINQPRRFLAKWLVNTYNLEEQNLEKKFIIDKTSPFFTIWKNFFTG